MFNPCSIQQIFVKSDLKGIVSMNFKNISSLIIAALVVVAIFYYFNASTSGKRVASTFNLGFEVSNHTSVDDIRDAILQELPTGSSKEELLSYLDASLFSSDSRNYIYDRKGDSDHPAVVVCSFSGSGIFEIVFREYSVVFEFANSPQDDLISDVRVVYGLTGL